MKRIKWWAGTGIILVLLIAALVLQKGSRADQNTYRTVPVSRGDIQSIVTSTGKLNPLNTVKVGAQVSGNIKEIYVDFNALVRKDQVIALIDPAIYDAQVEQEKAQLLKAKAQLQEMEKDIDAAEADIKSAEAQLFSAKATLREAELNYDRKVKLRNVVARAELDSDQAKRDNARGAVKAAEAKVLSTKAQLSRAIAQKKGVSALVAERGAALNLSEIKHGYCTIKSPIDGVVISRDVDVGQTVVSSLQSPELFSIAEDLTRMQVEVDVSEADVGRITSEQDVVFTVDAFPEKQFKAKVREVRNVATNIQNVVTYKIIADVDNNDLLLRPGMTANVSIVTAEVKNVLKLPNSALRFKPPVETRKETPGQRPPITERAIYKNLVEKLDLSVEQSEALVKIIEQAGRKLKVVYDLPEADRNIRQAWKNFYTQVMTNLYKHLKEDQHGKFRDCVAELREKVKQRSLLNSRSVKVYVSDEQGRPRVIKFTAGITNDDETQIVDGDLKEGDKAIVGMVYNKEETPKENRSILTSIFKGR